MRPAPPVLLLGVLMLAACTLPRPATRTPPGSTAAGTPLQWLANVQHDADLIDQSNDPARHTQLLADATANAKQCLARAPDSAACHYAQAQVLGLTARERPLEAPSALKDMLASLTRAESLDPTLDHAGPARLRAIVLMRAPPWPLGPGDVDAASVAAQHAVQRDAAYPPNLITLAQAQAKTDGKAQARETYTRAQQAVQAWNGAPGPDRARWQQAVDQGLQGLQ